MRLSRLFMRTPVPESERKAQGLVNGEAGAEDATELGRVDLFTPDS
jgi:hypothetical protein